MRGATLFSGIGCPEVAAPAIDWRFAAEVDPFASAVHATRFPDVPNLGDVTAPDFIERAQSHGPINLLVFGPPCQSFSVAGKRGGLDDDRGNLALVALGIARSLRPQWVVFENVPGMFSSDDGGDFAEFLRLMGECGYSGCWRVLNAQWFGVPQRRRRVFFVGYPGDWRPPAAVLFEPESLRGDPPPSREARQNTAAALEAHIAGGRRSGEPRDNLITGTLGWSEGDRVLRPVKPQGDHQFLAFNARQDPGSSPVTCPLDTDGGSIGIAAFTVSAQSNGFAWESEVAPTVQAHPQSDTSQRQTGIRVSSSVRRLSPLEAERLQGLPDNHTAITYRGKPAKDGPRYRAIGNGMAVPVIGWILDRIQMFESVMKAERAA